MKLSKKQLWKEAQATRKSELKEMAKELKIINGQVRIAMSEMSYKIKQYNIESNKSNTGIKYNCLSTVYNEYVKALHLQWGLQAKQLRLRQEYRCKHIIYCLYNGTPMEEIERSKNMGRYQQDTYKYSKEIQQAQKEQKEFRDKRNNWLNLMKIAV